MTRPVSDTAYRLVSDLTRVYSALETLHGVLELTAAERKEVFTTLRGVKERLQKAIGVNDD